MQTKIYLLKYQNDYFDQGESECVGWSFDKKELEDAVPAKLEEFKAKHPPRAAHHFFIDEVEKISI